MLRFRPTPRPALLLIACLALAGCKTGAERIAEHLASAEALTKAGDPDRALVEFRNVLKLDGTNRTARLAMAAILEDRGEYGRAIGHHAQVVDQTPDYAPSHAALARIAVIVQDWDAAEEHATRAYTLDPAPAEVRALYATVRMKNDAMAEAVEMAEAVLAEAPAEPRAHVIRITEALQADHLAEALHRTDTAIAASPDTLDFHLMRLMLLDRLDRQDEIRPQLEAMAARFPGQTEIEDNLIRAYVRDGDTAEAEAGLRARADAPGAPFEDIRRLIRYLAQIQGPEAARAEVAARMGQVEGAEAEAPLVRLAAAIAAEAGAPETAAEDLAQFLDGPAAGAAGLEVHEAQVMLAQLRQGLGDAEAAAALIAAVLEADPTHVSALKMRAARRTAADDTGGAIADLRAALDLAPRDPETLTLMAEAHAREGAHALAGERLALAVEASAQRAAESLRYASWLVGQGRLGPAEGVLVDGLRRTPDDIDLMAALGQVHLLRFDAERLGQVAALLDRQGAEGAARAADLRARLAAAEDDAEGTLTVLEARAEAVTGQERLAAGQALVAAYLRAGDTAAAADRLTALKRSFPDRPDLALLTARLAEAEGRAPEAEAAYRTLLETRPETAEAWGRLATLLSATGRDADARQALQDGIAATGHRLLMLEEAALLEGEGAIDAAIALYEDLYARASNDRVVANNLASLISAHRTGPEGLERAYTIARRLRGTDVPQFQDTYGWILAQRGETEEALTYLRPAAETLAEDPLVHYHLAMAEADAGNRDAAMAAFRTALTLAGDPAPARIAGQMETARTRLADLEATPPAPAEPAAN